MTETTNRSDDDQDPAAPAWQPPPEVPASQPAPGGQASQTPPEGPVWQPAPGGQASQTPPGAPVKRLYRSRDDRVIAGVCGGLAVYLGVDASLVRVLSVLSLLLPGPQILAYLVAWIIVPVAPPDHQQPAPPPAA